MSEQTVRDQPIATITKTNRKETQIPSRSSVTNDHLETDLPRVNIRMKIHRKGPISFDRSINQSEEILWFYLINNLKTKPSIKMEIHGYHTGIRTTYVHQQSTDGFWSMIPTQNLNEIDDFQFSIDFSSYIDSSWQRLRVAPEHAVNNWSIKFLLAEFIRSNNIRKQLICEKEILDWNFDDLTKKIKNFIFTSGYEGKININYSFSSNQIIAHSSSFWARITQSSFILRSFCFPLLWVLQSSNEHQRYRIAAEFHFLTSMENFLHSNSQLFLRAVEQKSFDTFVAEL